MTDKEFEELLNLRKIFERKDEKLPLKNEFGIYDIKSIHNNVKFILDIDRRGRIELSKAKVQKRYGKTKRALVRIDIDSPPHTNPDGRVLSRNHIHIYKETENDTGNLPWAYNLDEIKELALKTNPSFMDIFNAFCKYCNIDTTNIQGVI